MRASAVIATLSGITVALSAASYLATSKVMHKAELIRANPNGDIVWLERWEFNRAVSVVVGIVSLLVFVWAFTALYKAQRDEL